MEDSHRDISEREAAVLGLLCESPLYGYTIEKIIKDRGMRHWTDIGFSSIYYVLKRLEGRSLIMSSCKLQEDRPSRKIYTITGKGLDAMRNKVRMLLSCHTKIASPFDLGIAYIPLVPEHEVAECLEGRIRMLNAAIDHVELIRSQKSQENGPYHVLALFDRVLAHLKTEKLWVEGFMGEVKRRACTTAD